MKYIIALVIPSKVFARDFTAKGTLYFTKSETVQKQNCQLVEKATKKWRSYEWQQFCDKPNSSDEVCKTFYTVETKQEEVCSTIQANEPRDLFADYTLAVRMKWIAGRCRINTQADYNDDYRKFVINHTGRYELALYTNDGFLLALTEWDDIPVKGAFSAFVTKEVCELTRNITVTAIK